MRSSKRKKYKNKPSGKDSKKATIQQDIFHIYNEIEKNYVNRKFYLQREQIQNACSSNLIH